jgi:hypothetical protein
MRLASWQSDPLHRHEPRRMARAAVLVLVVGVAGVIALNSSGGGDSGVVAVRSESADNAESARTTLPATTPTTTTSAPSATTTTVVPETSTTVATTTTTPPPQTTSPPPAIAVATIDDLVAALPGQADMPLGLAPSGQPPDTAPIPASGLGAGYCGGDSAVQRAWNAAVMAIVTAEYLTSPAPGYLSVDLYAFATPENASLFMSLTASQETSCLGGFQYQLPEGDGPNDYDGFAGDFGLDAVWDMIDTLYYSPTTVFGAEEAFQMAAFYQSTTRYRGTTYATTSTEVTQYERHGRIVMVFNLFGECCQSGFEDIDPSLDYQPTTPELLSWVDSVRPGMIQRLQSLGVL